MDSVTALHAAPGGVAHTTRIEWINPITDSRWLDYISGNSSCGIYHHPAWLDLLGNFSRMEVLAVCLFKHNRLVNGIPALIDTVSVPKRQAFSIPCMNNNQSIWSESGAAITDTALLESLQQMHITHFTIRDILETSTLPKVLQGYIHFLDISEPIDALLTDSISPHCRRNIRKSEKSNIHISIHTDREAVLHFHQLHVLTRKRQGLPAVPLSFFNALHQSLITPGLACIIQVTVNSRVVCSGIFAGFNKIFSFKYGASHPGFSDYRPSYAMLWAAIQYAQQQGYKQFDFGRCELSNEGLRRFKRSWGAKEQPLYYSYYPAIPKNPVLLGTGKLLLQPLIKIAPCTFAKALGKAAYTLFPMMLA